MYSPGIMEKYLIEKESTGLPPNDTYFIMTKPGDFRYILEGSGSPGPASGFPAELATVAGMLPGKCHSHSQPPHHCPLQGLAS